VIDPGHFQRHPQSIARLPQNVQERHRIGAAGDGEQDPIAPLEERVRGDRAQNGRQHRCI
jgi:hypothetical protein